MLGHHQGFARPSPSSSSVAPAAATTPCDCEYEILRLANLCKHYAQIPAPRSVSSPSLSSSMTGGGGGGGGHIATATADNSTATTPGSPAFLSSTLTIASDLVQHWGAINGCPNVDSHISAHTLCTMTDAVGLVLRGHELAIEAGSKSKSSSYHHQHHHHHHAQNHESATTAATRAAGTGCRATIGRLELESSEAAIVAREALKQSIVRLAAMVQDIAEEAALMAQRNGQVAHPLRDRDVRGLTTRLFVTLASVDGYYVDE